MAKKKAMRRANGTGSVYKMSGNRRRPWVARVSDGVDEDDGKVFMKRRILGYFETEDEAKKALFGHQLDPVPAKSTITLKELHDEWSAFHYPKVSANSERAYKLGWHHMESIKNVKVKEIRRGQWERIVRSMVSDGLGTSSMKQMLSVATMLSTYAVQNDIIPKNYATGIVLPKEEKKEKEIFTDMEIRKIEKAAGKTPDADRVLILIYTGLRIQEFLNLTKFDVDLKTKIITGGIKTDAGRNRIIPIHPKILPHIKRLCKNAPESFLTPSNDPAVPLGQQVFRKHFYKALKAMEIERKNPHRCRDTFATMMARAGVNVNVIKEVMGHSNYAFTADKYTHMDTQTLIKQIEQV